MRVEHPVPLQLPRELRRDRGPLAELAETELLVLLGEAGRTLLPALLARAGRRGQLLPLGAKRQETVTLEPQDRLQPPDAAPGNSPGAAGRSSRRRADSRSASVAARAGPDPRGSGT